ncbi:acetate kinase [Kribbella flavida DSM 17836]|uniref:Acetate kinase n=1 Tax=Kribbella flavida (strain DSM 17836 / JCM 10339 / NBRC 14399) TaxID=479435 RepID=D2PWL4_KRIFD|nr:acetate kinase [Kribbella flavida]ADB33483.1 acetate kinase [Kribbella flavida DSM 17836]
MSDHVLVINAGSSSLKYSLMDAGSGAAAADGVIERIGEPQGHRRHRGPDGETESSDPIASHEDALRAALKAFETHGPSLDDVELAAVGHRVVHGGARFGAPSLVDDALIAEVSELVPLAPLHNPANLEGIEVARRLFPDLPQVAVFDTAFHQTLPPHAYTYAVPSDWLEQHGIRRYGFHGTSHSFVAEEAARRLGRDLTELNLIVLHLGNGCSASAVHGGRSVETSMGMTPLEGLVMGTRSGDLDPAIHGHLARELGWSIDEIDRVLNSASGLKGLAGENDFRELSRLRAAGDPRAELAFDVYCHRIKKYVGAYYAVLGTVDAIVFTAGVGQHSAEVRAAALQGLERLGIRLDPGRNAEPPGTGTVSADGSEVTVLVVATNEEWQIARQALAVVRR